MVCKQICNELVQKSQSKSFIGDKSRLVVFFKISIEYEHFRIHILTYNRLLLPIPGFSTPTVNLSAFLFLFSITKIAVLFSNLCFLFFYFHQYIDTCNCNFNPLLYFNVVFCQGRGYDQYTKMYEVQICNAYVHEEPELDTWILAEVSSPINMNCLTLHGH